MNIDFLKEVLDNKVEKYNQMGFIDMDPISIPHQYSSKQDIEITAFWTSILSWGQRKTIINKATELFQLMDNSPYDFIKNHQESDRKAFEHFKHRTFNYTDTLYFLEFLQNHYQKYPSLELAFLTSENATDSVESSLIGFQDYFMDSEFAPKRTRKHISSPVRKSSCKRLNMFLRWMVRTDSIVDLGIWNNIKPCQLMIPLDVHVYNSCVHLGIVTRKQKDWKTVCEITAHLRQLDPNDPVKYDFALFGMGVDG